MSPLEFAGRLMGYCAATEASVTSWGRTRDRNAAVDGHPQSYHLAWLGADVVYDRALESVARKAHARHVGLELIIEDDHDHLEPLP